MKLKHIAIAGLAVTLACACAKTPSAGLNDDAKRYFDAWISQTHPNAVRTPLGAYVISETAGTGESAGSHPFIRVNLSSYSLKGDLSQTTLESVARRNGSYSKTSYYGPMIAYRGEELETLGAGIEEAISTMKIGGRKTVAVPGWLSEAERFDNEEEYVKNCSGTDIVYELELVDAFDDVDAWERDSLVRFMAANYPDAVEDEEYEGFFYVKGTEGPGDKEIKTDSTVYINYTGRLLNGQVFDTTVADTAKVWNLYSSSKTYGRQKVKWYSADGDFTGITLGDDETTVITGFALGLSKMHQYEAGKCFFVSKYGYSASGSGSSIPSYSPLCFELEMTEEP